MKNFIIFPCSQYRDVENIIKYCSQAKNMCIGFFDIKIAYLYESIDKTVYMEAPPDLEKLIGDNKVCKLQKSIYGLSAI